MPLHSSGARLLGRRLILYGCDLSQGLSVASKCLDDAPFSSSCHHLQAWTSARRQEELLAQLRHCSSSPAQEMHAIAGLCSRWQCALLELRKTTMHSEPNLAKAMLFLFRIHRRCALRANSRATGRPSQRLEGQLQMQISCSCRCGSSSMLHDSSHGHGQQAMSFARHALCV